MTEEQARFYAMQYCKFHGLNSKNLDNLTFVHVRSSMHGEDSYLVLAPLTPEQLELYNLHEGLMYDRETQRRCVLIVYDTGEFQETEYTREYL